MKVSWFKFVVSLTALVCLGSSVQAQKVTFEKTRIAASKLGQVHPGDIEIDWKPSLVNVEMPMPGSSRHAMNEIKKRSATKYPRKATGIQSWNPSGTPPSIGKNFPVANTFQLPNGDTLVALIASGTPNDNTLAISDSGIVLTAFNSSLFTYDSNRDSMAMPTISLHAFTSQFTNNDKFDPKVIYDPNADRFILVFLNGRASFESLIIVCFSTSNDPSDPWNIYSLSGNPFNDSTWLDYPAIAITESELFVTGNQIHDAAPWQSGFSESVIWQVDKSNGYDGDSILTTTLWSNILFSDTNIRNIHPVQGGSWPAGPNQYLLSNRNFSILSDSMFLLEITGDQYDPNTVLNVSLGRPNVPYGMPPEGRESNGDMMATNDARVLGAFIENGEIQYVSVTLDTATGFAAIYHGFIKELDTTPAFTARVLVDDSLDLGYPNIAYTGSHSCSRQSIIGMDHTSPERDPGISALLYHSNDTYSKLISLKEAEGPVNKLGNTERWGDYFGIQRKYNEQNTVWTAGFYGRANNNYTWVSQLIATDEVSLAATITEVNDMSAYMINDGSMTVTVTDGYTPYTIQWDDPSQQTDSIANGLGKGTYTVTIIDGANCIVRDSMTIEEPLLIEEPRPESNIFPNPAVDVVTIYFELEATAVIDVKLYDAKGTLVEELFSDQAKSGSNIFTFSSNPLRAGTYILRVISGNKVIMTERIVKG
ncbi:MAG: T9SS type A sorting domain-containing protein [Flavobacteriales bacterium]|nr:T9SS type A sorting domain-containing protein [Flavobacteriales bacterium]